MCQRAGAILVPQRSHHFEQHIDSSASPRHRIEAARELRQTAAIGSEAATPTAERFSIRIDLTAGGNKDDVIVIDAPAKKVGPDVELEPDKDAAPRELLPIIAASKQRNGGDGKP